MATGDAYSRWVLFAKITLPLAALAILSTLFLFSGGFDPEGAIPFADVDVEEIAREQRLTNARYGSVTDDGAAIELSAGEARPDPENASLMRATDIAGSIALPDASLIELTSAGAIVDIEAQVAGLTDGVFLTSTTGVKVSASNVIAHMDTALLTAEGPLTAVTPFGSLEAGNLRLTRSPLPDGNYRLVFNDGVRLLYHPEKQEP